jgi:uncharacterized protein (TIGR03437 family)
VAALLLPEGDFQTDIMRLLRTTLLLILCSIWLPAQVLTDASLNGAYHFVHLLASVSPSAVTSNAYNLSGTITFDGNGGYTYSGRLGSGAGAPLPDFGSGVYSVAPNGFVTLDNPNPNVTNLKINARLGRDSEVVIGSSTEAKDGSIDFFAAVRAPVAAVNNTVLNGQYTGGLLGFLNGSDVALRSALLTFSSGGTGTLGNTAVIGHAVDINNDTNVEQAPTNASYAINGDGTGTVDFGSAAPLLSGAYDIFVSANGNYLLGSSSQEGGRQVFVAIKNFGSSAGDTDWNDDYWLAEILIDTAPSDRGFSADTGALRALGQGTVTVSERVYLMSQGFGASGFSYDFSGVNFFRIDPSSRGSLGSPANLADVNMAIGAPSGGKPSAFVGAQVNPVGEPAERHGIFFGVRRPALSGSGVFLNPLGVINGASFAVPTFPIAPGTIVSLFGTNLAPAGTNAEAQPPPPLPNSLAGVTVTVNGILAPLFSVKAGQEFDQINIQVPFAITGPAATIIVNNNGTLSNAVEVNVAATSPGVFSVNANGIGPGTITHLDFTQVTEDNPAVLGEYVSIFLTGLGAVNPPVADGIAGPIDPLSYAVDADNIHVRFNGDLEGLVQYAGIAPTFVGLYQINVKIPDDPSLVGLAAVLIETSNADSDFVDIEIGF